uniref:Reverse transcriptase zinc-binding domain-containing protein n=1 Tax=Quercus lobata TaxID=97700 RepID=A0A7N2N5L9_QUELO
MGFRDIRAFNLATLAKQVWQLIHHTHSLFYRVYKARYFPNCSLLEAELGHKPLTKIYATFAPRTRNEILAIPLSLRRSREKLIWKANSKHEFTVKSSYHVAIRLRQQADIEHSRAQEDSKWWKLIWAMKVPPKVKTFIWRACSTVLPTRANLQRRRVQVCSQQPETCPFARNVWAMMRGRVQKCSNEMQDFFLLFKMLGDKLCKMELEQWAVLSWSIWNARNKFYFEKLQTHPKVILEGGRPYTKPTSGSLQLKKQFEMCILSVFVYYVKELAIV